MSRERPDLVAWATRLVAAAVDQGQMRGSEWVASAEHFLATAKAERRTRELNDFVREFEHGWSVTRAAHPDEPVPMRAILGDADLVACVYRVIGAAGARGSLLMDVPTLAEEIEPFYAVAVQMMQAMDEAGAIVRREAFEADRHLVARVRELEKALDGILRQFVHKGHPGYDARQTNWVPADIVQEWRDVLAGRPPLADTTTVLDKVPAEAADAADR